MISIFDDDDKRRSIEWCGVDFNDPDATAKSGILTDTVSFNTPSNFTSEPKDDIVKGGGGIELYNPHSGTRILTLTGHAHAATESALNSLLRPMQEAFAPLFLQATQGKTYGGTLTWPPPSGTPEWVFNKPLTFTRVMPKSFASATPSGKLLLQYYVVPLALPDPIRSVTSTGLGVKWEASWLIMEGGRSFAQSETSVSGDGTAAVTWNKALMWPRFHWTMSGAGDNNMTITVSSGHVGDALVLDLSGLSNADYVDVLSSRRTIYLNGSKDESLYKSGDYPTLYTTGGTVAWTNTTNVTSNLMYYSESDWF